MSSMSSAILVIFWALTLISSMAWERSSMRMFASRMHWEISSVFTLVWLLLFVTLARLSFTWDTSSTSSSVDRVCSMEA